MVRLEPSASDSVACACPSTAVPGTIGWGWGCAVVTEVGKAVGVPEGVPGSARGRAPWPSKTRLQLQKARDTLKPPGLPSVASR